MSTKDDDDDFWKSQTLRLVGLCEQLELLLGDYEKELFLHKDHRYERKVILSMLFNDQKQKIFEKLNKPPTS
jgi:hypothetical protein